MDDSEGVELEGFRDESPPEGGRAEGSNNGWNGQHVTLRRYCRAICQGVLIQCDFVNDLTGVHWVSLTLKAQLLSELMHVGVARRVDRYHLHKAIAPCCVEQVLHEQLTHAQMLPFIGNRHRALALSLFFQRRVTTHAYFDQLAVLMRQRYVSHSLFAINVHQLVEQGGAGFIHGPEKAEMARLRGELFDEIKLSIPVMRCQGPDQDMGPVTKQINPVFTFDAWKRGTAADRAFWRYCHVDSSVARSGSVFKRGTFESLVRLVRYCHLIQIKSPCCAERPG